MQNPFHIDAERSGDAAVLRLRGELDVASASRLEQALADVTQDAPRIVVVDLGGVEFMDSTGLRVVLSANERAQEAAQEFALVEGPPQVQRLLELTRARERLRIASDLRELLG
ncbi:MAG TPA: STAS domain-containing protein [Solirubrobacteraceae bacterium]|jgi:anti-sigma B factor antagonist|nr:STAS domain-containing protein [Solirubrobacteraceae bacterium]